MCHVFTIIFFMDSSCSIIRDCIMAWQALFLKIMQFFPVQKALQPRACFEFLSFKHLISGFQRLFMFMFQ